MQIPPPPPLVELFEVVELLLIAPFWPTHIPNVVLRVETHPLTSTLLPATIPPAPSDLGPDGAPRLALALQSFTLEPSPTEMPFSEFELA